MSFFRGLSEAGRKVWHFIYRGVKQLWSEVKIAEELIRHGLGYRISEMLQDIRAIRGEAIKHEAMEKVPKSRIISPELYTPSVFTAKYNYITHYLIEYQDLDTGEKGQIYTSIGHSAPMRRSDLDKIAEETAAHRLIGYEGVARFRILKVTPVGGHRRI